MKRIVWLAAAALALTGIVGCESTDGTEGETTGVMGASTLTQAGALASEECKNGGVDLKHGIDSNGDGELQDDEVKEVYTICNGESADKEKVDDNAKEVTDFKAEIVTLKEELAKRPKKEELDEEFAKKEEV
ncbi:MAG: hypothetical protein VX938_10780, partial [Myxococcota bacterium]|nr:hypothetical protein [Myxococcota bacterium]